MSATTKLGFIGLGQMGSPMAERLVGPDVELHVFDQSAAAVAKLTDAGAIAHNSPRQVADAATIVFACLPSQKVSEAVAFGPDGVAGGSSIKFYVEMSTIGKVCIETIAGELAKKGIDTVDGPISGGPPAAREGRLAMMASGSPAAMAEVAPWLQRIGRKVYALGDKPGQAQIMKLVNNLVMAANLVTAAEVLVMGAKAGLKAEDMVDVVSAGTGQSFAMSNILGPSALTGRFDYGAHLSIVAKDMLLGKSEFEKLGLDLPMMQLASSLWQDALGEGMGGEDFSKIHGYVEDRNGVKARFEDGETG